MRVNMPMFESGFENTFSVGDYVMAEATFRTARRFDSQE
jgi:hypothetical protein